MPKFNSWFIFLVLLNHTVAASSADGPSQEDIVLRYEMEQHQWKEERKSLHSQIDNLQDTLWDKDMQLIEANRKNNDLLRKNQQFDEWRRSIQQRVTQEIASAQDEQIQHQAQMDAMRAANEAMKLDLGKQLDDFMTMERCYKVELSALQREIGELRADSTRPVIGRVIRGSGMPPLLTAQESEAKSPRSYVEMTGASIQPPLSTSASNPSSTAVLQNQIHELEAQIERFKVEEQSNRLAMIRGNIEINELIWELNAMRKKIAEMPMALPLMDDTDKNNAQSAGGQSKHKVDDDKASASLEDYQQRLRKAIDPDKYKTRMCTRYPFVKHCPFGDKCAFAHDYSELRWRGDGTGASLPELPPLEPLE